MVEFKLREVTWTEKKALSKAVQECGLTMKDCALRGEWPIEAVEAALSVGVEGYDTDDEKSSLSYGDMQNAAMLVYNSAFFKLEIEKKS